MIGSAKAAFMAQIAAAAAQSGAKGGAEDFAKALSKIAGNDGRAAGQSGITTKDSKHPVTGGGAEVIGRDPIRSPGIPKIDRPIMDGPAPKPTLITTPGGRAEAPRDIAQQIRKDLRGELSDAAQLTGQERREAFNDIAMTISKLANVFSDSSSVQGVLKQTANILERLMAVTTTNDPTPIVGGPEPIDDMPGFPVDKPDPILVKPGPMKPIDDMPGFPVDKPDPILVKPGPMKPIDDKPAIPVKIALPEMTATPVSSKDLPKIDIGDTGPDRIGGDAAVSKRSGEGSVSALTGFVQRMAEAKLEAASEATIEGSDSDAGKLTTRKS